MSTASSIKAIMAGIGSATWGAKLSVIPGSHPARTAMLMLDRKRIVRDYPGDAPILPVAWRERLRSSRTETAV
jgi:hypothetical protein